MNCWICLAKGAVSGVMDVWALKRHLEEAHGMKE